MLGVAVAMAACTASSGGSAGRGSPSSAVPPAAATPSSSRASTAARPPTLASPAGTPTASSDDGVAATYPTVGALFHDGAHGSHGCTASVVASSTQNTVLTAAHCVSGTMVGTLFIPGYRRGAAPEGVWQVTGAYVSPSWQRDQDPQFDYAVLTVVAHYPGRRAVRLAAVTGSERLGTSPASGTEVTVVAYRSGSNDVPVVCRAPVYHIQGFPTIDCHGFTGGTSGSPWLATDATGGLVVRGVIGGREAGGCREYRSHSSSFTADVAALIRRAEHESPPDAVQPAGSTGC